MNRKYHLISYLTAALGVSLALAGCSSGGGDETAEAQPPSPAVEAGNDQADADRSHSEGPRQFSGGNSMWNYDQPMGEPVAEFV